MSIFGVNIRINMSFSLSRGLGRLAGGVGKFLGGHGGDQRLDVLLHGWRPVRLLLHPEGDHLPFPLHSHLHNVG